MSAAALARGVEAMAPIRAAASPEVDAYIDDAPTSVQGPLRAVRALIRATIPDAVEVISYRMPGFSYPGYPYKGMIVWFARQRQHIGLYLRPPTIADHQKELAGYETTKSAVHLPIGRPIPSALVRKLVRASARIVMASRRDTAPRAPSAKASAARPR